MNSTNENTVVASYASHEDAEKAVKELQRSGFDMKKLSIVGKDFHTDEHPVGFYNMGDRMAYWGRNGAFWGSLWAIFFGSALLFIPVVGHVIVLGPLVAAFVNALGGAAVGGSVGILGGALASIGIPENSVVEYEQQLSAGRFLIVAHGDSLQTARAHKVLQEAGASAVTTHGA